MTGNKHHNVDEEMKGEDELQQDAFTQKQISVITEIVSRQIKNAFAPMETRLTQLFVAMEDRLSKRMDDKFAAMEERLSKRMGDTFAVMDERMSKLEDQLGTMEDRLSNRIDDQFVTMEDRLSNKVHAIVAKAFRKIATEMDN